MFLRSFIMSQEYMRKEEDGVSRGTVIMERGPCK